MWPFKKKFKSKITPPWDCSCSDIYCRGFVPTEKELINYTLDIEKEKREWELANNMLS